MNTLSKNVLLKWKHIVLSTNDSCNKFTISENDKKTELYYSKFLLSKYFKYWCNYITMIKKKEELLQKVVTFHNLYCLKKCIINWKIYILLRKRKEIEKNKINKVTLNNQHFNYDFFFFDL